MNIIDIRAKYPQYQDMSDRQLADALHAKHYSDMPKAEFYSKVGLDKERPQLSRKADLYRTDPTALIPGAEQRIEPSPRPPTTIGEDIIGAGETALTLGTGATSGALGMVGGMLGGIGKEIGAGTFGTTEAANRAEQAALEAMQRFTYAPRTRAGRQQVGAIGEAAQALAPMAGLPGQMSAIASGMKPAISMAGRTAVPVQEAVTGAFKVQSPTKQRIANLIQGGSTDIETAKFMIKKPGAAPSVPTKLQKFLNIGGPTVKKDPVAVKAIRQGFDEGVVAAIKGSSIADKQKMKQMVSIMERGKQNARFAAQNRPSDVAGNTLLQRVKSIRNANRQSGRDIDRIARTLKGKSVDISEATSAFGNQLDELGVRLVSDGKGGFTPDFKLSQLSPGDRGPIKEVLRQMSIARPDVDAFAAHRMKRIIDNNVTYGKVKTGMSGDAERVLKAFRRDLDTKLDSAFPAYNRANTKYSNTIGALDSIQDVVGKKMDLSGGNADKALGTVLRRTLSNAQSRVRLVDSINEIEAIAKKYGGSDLKRLRGLGLGRDDLLTQVLFVDELDSVFGPVARTSFQGQIDQALKQGVNVAASQQGAISAGVSAAGKMAGKLIGIDEASAFKSIKELLKQ